MRQRLFFALFFLSLPSFFCTALLAEKDYGIGVLRQLTNLTPFPASFYASRGLAGLSVQSIAQMPPGTLVRIQSRSPSFPTGPYFTIKKGETFPSLVIANANEDTQAGSLFTVARYRDIKGTYWLSLRLKNDGDLANDLCMTSEGDNSSVVFNTFSYNTDSAQSSHWLIEGDEQSGYFLKSRATGGYLQPVPEQIGGDLLAKYASQGAIVQIRSHKNGLYYKPVPFGKAPKKADKQEYILLAVGKKDDPQTQFRVTVMPEKKKKLKGDELEPAALPSGVATPAASKEAGSPATSSYAQSTAQASYAALNSSPADSSSASILPENYAINFSCVDPAFQNKPVVFIEDKKLLMLTDKFKIDKEDYYWKLRDFDEELVRKTEDEIGKPVGLKCYLESAGKEGIFLTAMPLADAKKFGASEKNLSGQDTTSLVGVTTTRIYKEGTVLPDKKKDKKNVLPFAKKGAASTQEDQGVEDQRVTVELVHESLQVDAIARTGLFDSSFSKKDDLGRLMIEMVALPIPPADFEPIGRVQAIGVDGKEDEACCVNNRGVLFLKEAEDSYKPSSVQGLPTVDSPFGHAKQPVLKASIGRDGTLVAITGEYNPVKQGHSLFAFDRSAATWRRMPGYFKHVSVADAGNIVALDEQGNMFEYKGLPASFKKQKSAAVVTAKASTPSPVSAPAVDQVKKTVAPTKKQALPPTTSPAAEKDEETTDQEDAADAPEDSSGKQSADIEKVDSNTMDDPVVPVAEVAGAWNALPSLPTGTPMDLSIGIDGTTWALSRDLKLYLLDRKNKGWIQPAPDMQALKISVYNKNTVALLHPSGSVYRLAPKSEGQSWTEIRGSLYEMCLLDENRALGIGGSAAELGLQLLKGSLGYETEIEPESSFDTRPYRLPPRAGGREIKGGETKNMSDFGFAQGVEFSRSPEVRGFGYELIPGFSSGFLLEVGSLWGQGFAWLKESLPSPGQATIVFRARATNYGDLHVIFGEGPATSYLYRVIFGGLKNTKSAVLKKGEDVMAPPVSVDKDSRAQVAAGRFEQYWVSVKNGFFMVGKGVPGQNIFISSPDPTPPKTSNGASRINNIGFSSFTSDSDTSCEITEVMVMPPLNFVGKKRTLWQQTSPIKPGKGTISWLKDMPFRPRDKGALVCKAKGEGAFSIHFATAAQDKYDGYEVFLSSKGPVFTAIYRNSGGVKSLVYENRHFSAPFQAGVESLYWISFNQGLIAVGYGDYVKNPVPIAVWQDYPEKMVRNISLAGISGGDTSPQISSTVLARPVKVDFEDPLASYSAEQDRYKFKSEVAVVTPFRYQLDQVFQGLQVKDMIAGTSYQLGATAEQGRTYPYRMNLQPDSTPSLQLLDAGKESSEKMTLKKQVSILQATADITTQVAGAVALAGPIGMAASLILGATAVGTGIAAAAQRAKLEQYRDPQSYVMTENYQLRQQTQAGDTSEMSQQLQQAIGELSKADMLNTGTPDGFVALLQTYQNVVFLADNFVVANSSFVKKKLVNGIDDLYNSYKNQPTSELSKLLRLLISAYDNFYITNVSSAEDMQNKALWHSYMNTLVSTIVAEKNDSPEGIILSRLRGEFVWLVDKKLPAPNKGCLIFDAQGTSDIAFCFGATPTAVKNTDMELYAVHIGGDNNTVTRLYNDENGPPVVEVTAKQKPEAMCPGAHNFKTFWCNIDRLKVPLAQGGTREVAEIMVGQGEINEANIIFVWYDPYPVPDISYVGLGAWSTPVTFKNIFVGPSIKKEEPQAPATTVKKKTTVKKESSTA